MRRLVATPLHALVVLLALAAAAPVVASAQEPRFGAWNPGDPYMGHTNGANALEAATGRRVEIVHWYQGWGGGAFGAAVQPQSLEAVARSGRTPLVTWEPWTPTAGLAQPDFQLARIAAGAYDAYISEWAAALRLVGSPVYLRPMHEFNGDWYPWSGAVNGNTPEQFVQAWRHIVDVFRGLGVVNVRFVWSPNNIDVPAANAMERYYPGDAYVDVLAVDGYNWGAGTPEFGGWQTFSQVFMRAYERLSAIGPQPIWIAEVGTTDDGGDKAAWIRDMFARASSMDRLEAIVWFNEAKERDWRAVPTPHIGAAFSPGAAELLPEAADSVAGDGARAARDGGVAGDSSTGAGAASRAAPRLRLTLVRRGASMTVRWRVTPRAGVARWYVSVNGRRVASAVTRARGARVRVPGVRRQAWTVRGVDEAGRTIVRATRRIQLRRATG